jgi:hypothetical protein
LDLFPWKKAAGRGGARLSPLSPLCQSWYVTGWTLPYIHCKPVSRGPEEPIQNCFISSTSPISERAWISFKIPRICFLLLLIGWY